MKNYCLLLGIALAAPLALHAQQPVGELFAGDANVLGSVTFSAGGTHVLSGSQISAGDGAALLKLARGGDLRICPRTNLSLSADASGRSLVLGMNVGSMELNYSLPSSADSLITPDFRMQLISPGTFHLAISVAPSGDTCVRSLPGNDAAVFIAEMMGSDSYQLTPGKNVLFRAGKISGATTAVPASCGCPELQQQPKLPELAEAIPAEKPAPPPPPPASTPLPHMEIDSTFVYRGNEAVQDYYTSVSRLSISTDNSKLALALLPQVNGPVPPDKPQEKKKGLLHRFGNMLGRLFRH